MAEVRSPKIYDPYLGEMYGNILDQYDNPAYNIRFYLKPEENSTVNETAAAAAGSPPPIDGDLAGSPEFQGQDARSDQSSTVTAQTRTVSDKKIVILAQNGVTGAQIDDLEIETANYNDLVTKALSGSFTIIQPGAANFLDQMQWARKYLGESDDKLRTNDFYSYLDINFLGYDSDIEDNEEAGEATQIVETTTYKIRITEIAVRLDNTGSRYDFKFNIADTIGFADEIYKLPKNLSLQGSTITELLTGGTGLEGVYNAALRELSTEFSVADRIEINMSALVSNEETAGATNSTGASNERLYIRDESIPTSGTDQTVETTTAPIFNGEVQSTRIARTEADGASASGTKGESTKPGIQLSLKEGNSIYTVIAQVLSMNREFQSYASRMESLNDPGNNEVDNTQTFVAWFDVHCEIQNIKWDKKRNKYAKKYIYTPYLIQDIRSDIALTTNELSFLSETSEFNGQEVPLTAIATKRLQDLYNSNCLHKSYFYTFTGLNDQILNLDISYDTAVSLLMPPKGGFAGDYSVTSGTTVRNSLSVNEDPTGDAAAEAASNTQNRESLLGLLNQIKGLSDSIQNVANAIGRDPEDLAGILNDATGASARALVDSLSSASITNLTRSLGNSDGSDPTDTPTTNTEFTVTSFGDYTPEVSGFLYGEDFVQPGGSLTQEELQDLGLISVSTPTDASPGQPVVRSIPSPLNGITSDGPASVLMGYLYRARESSGFMLTIEMTLRGDPYWLSNKNSGRFEYGKPTPDRTTNPPAQRRNYFLLTVGSPRRYDYDINDEDNNSGYWSDGSTSGVFSGLYYPTEWKHRFSNGIFTTEIKAAKEITVPLQWIRRVPPGETPPAWDEILNDVDYAGILNEVGLSNQRIISNQAGGTGDEEPSSNINSNPTPPNPSGFANPLGDAAYRLSSDFGPRGAPTEGASTNHEGVDMSAPSGTPVYPAKGGTVVYSGSLPGYGQVVYIDHGDGTQTRYGHLLAGSRQFDEGSTVTPSTIIGQVGNTGISTGSHLHYEVRVGTSSSVADADTTPIDPRPYLGR